MKFTIFVASDGTGETANTMTQAALVQFKNRNVSLIRKKNIRSEEQIQSIVDEAKEKNAFIVFTIVTEKLNKKLEAYAVEKNVPAVDLLGPLLFGLSQYFGIKEPLQQAGILRTVDATYFKRIEAIEFTVKHDDGKLLNDLNEADVVLVGISRTSKTPLSIYLSHKGWKVANIPLVLNSAPPKELFEIDQKKIIALTIDGSKLKKIRRNRLEKFNQDPGGDYASDNQIQEEIEFASELYKKNRKWPVFDVTDKALEETATEIAKLLANRLGRKEELSIT